MTEDALTCIAARADLCRLLAASYYQPGPEFGEETVFDSLAAAAATVDAELSERAAALREAFATEPLLDLQVDYTRLFMNPSGALAAPYESVWRGQRDPAVAHEVAEAVRAAYREGGFELDEGFRDLPDHVAAELEFLYALIYGEARARSLGDVPSEERSTALRRQFVDRHIGQWIGPFCRGVSAAADTRFYRALADLTERFVVRERA